ncbi:amino acid synthesis family protein [Aeromicrobium sp. Root472D3]|uniref:amino acid synthesis family protein n=1 Tax=Aeromicrobium sp. Root472D3 TaxID=1736540 RepID=UPI00190FFC4C|nr:amino acid synthesis family protein [Aeromicrobium sp. Root472D3]
MRQFHTLVEETVTEGGVTLPRVVRRVVVAAVVTNPWAGRAHVDDLSTFVRQSCPALARDVMARILPHHAGDDRVEAFGKAVVVGLAGEVEHGAALVHNPFFSDVVRSAVAGTSVIASTEARGEAGTTVHVPLCHVTSASTRSHYQGCAVSVPDAPHPDEIVVVVATSSAGRPMPRIGDRLTDPPFDPTPWRVPS